MTRDLPMPSPVNGGTRRQFLRALAASSLLLGMPHGWASTVPLPSRRKVAELSGTRFDLVVSETTVDFTGARRPATTINGSIPAPTLRWRQGETVTIRVTNHLATSTSIHWHGIILPYEMDGVPGVSFPGIAPGETFTYRFKVQQSGTYWYHSHTAFQEQTGMYGAIVVEPAAGERFPADRDHVVVLSDWTDEDPMALFARLKVQSDYFNYNKLTFADFAKDVEAAGIKDALAMRQMWNLMRMSQTDFADLSSATYSYLFNGHTPADNWTGTFRKGERIRLRFVNGATNSFYDVRIPGTPLRVVQIDGQDIEPVTVDEFRFGPGETCDVVVAPLEDAVTVFAQSMDRTGYASGTLAVRDGLRSPVPKVDAPQRLSMTDMMGAAAATHGAHAMTAAAAPATPMSMHAGHMPAAAAAPAAAPVVRHARTEAGPSTNMRVDQPRVNLDDPGVGLRANGRRVLTLADLRSLEPFADQRDPGRDLELHLTGNMERYSWSFDGLEFGASTPVHFRPGERLRIILHNDTMMTHPMHLHGMWSDLEDPVAGVTVRRHTIPVQPAQRVAFRVTADALGRWAWHCHLLFHMDAGMFREVVVA